MLRWWECFPERLELEELALREAGLRYAIDEAAWAAGRLEIEVIVPHPLEAGELALLARFPDSYPYFPPLVFSSDICLSRHQHPTERQLCLLADHGEDWCPESDRLAKLILEQLPKLASTALAEGSKEATENEAHQGEPLTAFLDYEPNSHVSVSPLPQGVDHDRGTLILGLDNGLPFRGTVLRVIGSDQMVVAEASPGLKNRYKKSRVKEIQGRWYRLPEKPRSCDPEGLLAEWKNAFPDEKHLWQQVSVPIQDSNGKEVNKFEVIGLVFEDELAWRNHRNNWLILVNRRYAKPLPGGGYIKSALIRSELESAELRKARIPELSPLAEKKVAVFGLGSLGSVAATELTRAGVAELALLDGDLLEVGNGVRWAAGRRYAGFRKVDALGSLILEEYPHIGIRGRIHRIGLSMPPAVGDNPDSNLDGEVIEYMLKGVDLVLDASASIRLNQYLADMSAERSIPYIWMSTTNGGWGGLVGRIMPSRTTGCWMCHLYGLEDGSIKLPASKSNGQVQPAGCMDPTFTGASFDLAEVTMMGVRLAVSTLCSDREDAYPHFDWDLAILDLRDSTGQPISPQWRTYVLDPHSNCCGS